MKKWPNFLPFFLLLIGIATSPTTAFAKDKLALFIITPKGNKVAQKTGAILNWMALQLAHKEAQQNDTFDFLDRGLFFSRSNALSARRWNQRASRSAADGYQMYTSEPANAASRLLRVSRFFEFAYKYYLQTDELRKALFFTGILQFRKGQKSRGIRTLKKAILLDPDAELPSEFDDNEKELIRAIKCQMGKQKTASIIIRTAPDGAVYLNGRLVGFGSMTIDNLVPGEYFLTVARDGYRNWGRKVRLRPGQRRSIRSFNRRSPQYSFYSSLCSKLAACKEGEQLTDELKKALQMFRNQAVSRIFVGCFAPVADGESGYLNWYALSSQGNAKKGVAKIPTGQASRVKSLLNALQSIGVQIMETSLPPINQHRYFKTKGSCKDPRKIALRPLGEELQHSRPVWTESPGDHVVIYTRYGFRIQGTVIAINGSILTLQISSNYRDPAFLQEVKIDRKNVKWSFILGPQQEGGFRIGERLIVQTIYDLNIHGTLVADDGDRIRLRTKFGITSIPWSLIRRMIRRDQ